MSTTYEDFAETMRRHYQTSNLAGISPEEFKEKIDWFLNLRDGGMEGFLDTEKQRDLSVRFHWGHSHDFGGFALSGLMGDRHLSVPAEFVDEFKAIPIDLTGKDVLDIGVWTGGSSLLFCALGAQVLAIEEVKKYADAVEYLKQAFNLGNLSVLNKSLYDLNGPEFYERFDYAFFVGVIYHVTDPILALRIVFNALRNGGTCMLESFAVEGDSCFLEYLGPSVFGTGTTEDLSRIGWNWFVPSRKALQRMLLDVGFQDVVVGEIKNQRVLATAKRLRHSDFLRAGLSVREVP